jgi:hypothetical protein
MNNSLQKNLRDNDRTRTKSRVNTMSIMRRIKQDEKKNELISTTRTRTKSRNSHDANTHLSPKSKKNKQRKNNKKYTKKQQTWTQWLQEKTYDTYNWGYNMIFPK